MIFLIIIICFTSKQVVLSQEDKPFLKVFLENFDNDDIDEEYIKNNIPIIDLVYDRDISNIMIIASKENTGSQGTRFVFFVEGIGAFSNLSDTILFTVSPLLTFHERRKIIIKWLKRALVPFLFEAGLTANINIVITGSGQNQVDTLGNKRKDIWNYWYNEISLTTYQNSNETNTRTSFYSNIKTQRITDKMKWLFSINSYYNESVFSMNDGSNYTSISRSSSFSGEGIISINKNWSAGARIYISNSSYSNIKLKYSFGPAIEYNFFPYNSSDKHMLTLYYSFSTQKNQYYDTTIYNKMEDFMLREYILLSCKFIKKWGDIRSGISFENYMSNFDLNAIWFYTATNIRIVKKLFFEVSASGGFSHNQIYISKGYLTPNEILTSQKQRQSTYSYNFRIGFNYKFGSTSNHIVNPRML